MKSVLVTGATGYLGANIVLYLSKQGFLVYALCRSMPKGTQAKFSNVEIISGDITSPQTLKQLSSKPIDYVIHTVSLDHSQSETLSIEVVNKTNVLATWQLLELFTKLNIKKFIYLSTMHVLGKVPSERINETYAKNPVNKYGLTHSIGEELVNYYNQKTDTYCVSLRLSNGYGAPVFNENNCWWLVVNDLCKTAFYNKKIVLSSDGTPARDFIHINDISKAISKILNDTQIKDTIINVSSGKTQSLLQIAHKVKLVYEKRYNSPISIFYSTSILSEEPPVAVQSYTIENCRLLSIGFSPEISLDNGIEELFIYFENLNKNHA